MSLVSDVDEAFRQANRLHKLKTLMGYIQNGSHQTVSIFQDDATRSYFVKIHLFGGKEKSWHGPSLEAAIDSIPDSELEFY